MTHQQSKTELLADVLEATPDIQMRAREAAVELRRLSKHETALQEWLDRTEWVQETGKSHELGMHRADVMRYRLNALRVSLQKLLDQYDSAVRSEYEGTSMLEELLSDADHARKALMDTE